MEPYGRSGAQDLRVRERSSMSIRDRYPPAKLPDTHYFLTVSRGERVRVFAVRPAVAFVSLAAAPLLALWAFAATGFIACHDEIMTAMLSHDAQVQTDYESKLGEARAERDSATSRRLLADATLESKMRELVARQARLELRGVTVAALAAEASASATALADARPHGATRAQSALAAIQAATPSDGDLGPASAYAPVAPKPQAQTSSKPRPLDGDGLTRAEPVDRLSGELSAAAADSTLDASARVGLLSYSLDRVERTQISTLSGVAKAARRAAEKMENVVARTGLSPAALKAPAGVGGPFIPITPGADAFDRAAHDAARELEAAHRLRELMPHIPLRYPLVGEASMSSPFGYRTDPFLGRPALHPGVDLIQPPGSEIKATAIGRVVHAGPMGGYGNCVEVDHGNGVATRYGHMSEVLVTEGQTVRAGDTIGRIGSTGRSTGPHLHYEVRVDGEPVDPERFLNAARD
jgi:murein DD-endopeptidase MepM/ murein hydrolase activator NlpD